MSEQSEIPAGNDESSDAKSSWKQAWKKRAPLLLPGLAFLYATYLAIRGTFAYNVHPSNFYWLSAGWIFAALAVIVTMVWASSVGDRESEDKRAERKQLRRLAEEQALLAKQFIGPVRAAQAAVDESEKSRNEDSMRTTRAELSHVLAQAQYATEQAVRYSEKAGTIPTIFTRNSIPATLIATINLFIVCGLVIVTFYTAASARGWAGAMIWSCAFLIIGGAAGFLFGLPRLAGDHKTTSLQSPQSVGGNQPQQSSGSPSLSSHSMSIQPASITVQSQQSPIEQMADWLTKTIVGVALVNLKQIPGQLHELSGVVARSIKDEATFPAYGPSTSFSLGLIIYFTMVGFLCGYLITQMFLLDYVNRRSVS
jgi:hypothetical protein